MPVNLSTGNGAYAVKASRIQKFVTAENRADALKMGGWDKFKDLFRGANNKKADKIANIYDSIVNAAPNNRPPLAMLDRIHALKGMAASPADRAQFSVTYQAPRADGGAPHETWGYAFAIGGTRIHEQNGLPDIHGSLGRTFEQAMLVKELEHHIDQLPHQFQQSEANRSIDQQYINDRVSIMASRADGGSGQHKTTLLANLDSGFFCAANLQSVTATADGQALVAVYSSEGETKQLEFNGKADPRDPLMPCGDTLKRWLQGEDYSSLSNLIGKKVKTIDDNKSVNDFKGLSLKVIQDVHAALGKPVDPLALMTGAAQADLAEAIRAVHEERPESSAPTIAKLFNMKIDGYTDVASDFVVENFLGKRFCDANPDFLSSARQVAANASIAPAAVEDAAPDEAFVQDVPPVPDLRAPQQPADRFLAGHLVNYRKLDILGTTVGGGARPAGDYLREGATQQQVLAEIKAAGFSTILSIDQSEDSAGLTRAIEQAGLKHEIGSQYEFPDWEHAPDDLYLGIKGFIENKARNGEKVFIHCGAGNGRTGAVLSALALSDLLGKERSSREQRGQSFTMADYAAAPRIGVSSDFKVPRDEDGDREIDFTGNEKPAVQESTSYQLPYFVAHAVQAVRDAVRDSPIPTGKAVETNEQLVDVANFAQYLLPPAPVQRQQFA